ncbi:sensor histidine kinase [Aquiflexum sp.]|uniref:sensor histidine kinase n=1 Tax=Aquiflexum sp. TaxID=1872584 RepID=UPI0035941DB8
MQKLIYFIVHFLFWTTFVALSWMSVSSNPAELEFLFTHAGAPYILLLWGIINFYSFYYYFQPLFLDSGRYFSYLIVSVMFSAIMSLVFVSIFWLMYPSFREFAPQKFMEGMIGSFLICQCGSLLRGFISWNQNLQNKTALENQSLRNELAMLKAQLSPHFLFNTLNNIDTLIYQSQDEASAMLIKLSGLLRYMLYESDGKKVPIEKEIAYIRQLTELQQMRFEQSDYVELIVNKSTNELTIAPLIFLPFIENAFKFVSKPPTMPAITIHLDVSDDLVRLTCRNYFIDRLQETNNKRQGIGLTNARRRLELLYSDSFDLEISTKDNWFEVNLSIKTS